MYNTPIRYSEQDVRTHYSFSAESELAQNVLGWSPHIGLHDGLIELASQFI